MMFCNKLIISVKHNSIPMDTIESRHGETASKGLGSFTNDDIWQKVTFPLLQCKQDGEILAVNPAFKHRFFPEFNEDTSLHLYDLISSFEKSRISMALKCVNEGSDQHLNQVEMIGGGSYDLHLFNQVQNAGIICTVVPTMNPKNQTFQHIFYDNPHPMWIYAVETCRFLEVNNAAIEQYGYTREAFLTMTIQQLRSETVESKIGSHIHQVETDFSKIKEVFQHRTFTGQIIHVELSAWDIEYQGVKARTVLVSNVTKRVEAEEALRVSEARLKESNAQKDKFFSVIAHDLRSPFSGFLGMTSLMNESLELFEKTEIQEFAHQLNKSANQLFSLLENLLEWARMQQGLVALKPERINAGRELLIILDILQANLLQKNLKLVRSLPENIFVNADKNMFHAIFRNLLSNAVKFTPRGGEITVLAEVTNQEITIMVKDSGIGMDETMVQNLFSLTEKSNRIGTENESSSGLGLLLVKEYVNKNNGKISVKSIEDMGSTFRVTFPMVF